MTNIYTVVDYRNELGHTQVRLATDINDWVKSIPVKSSDIPKKAIKINDWDISRYERGKSEEIPENRVQIIEAYLVENVDSERYPIVGLAELQASLKEVEVQGGETAKIQDSPEASTEVKVIEDSLKTIPDFEVIPEPTEEVSDVEHAVIDKAPYHEILAEFLEIVDQSRTAKRECQEDTLVATIYGMTELCQMMTRIKHRLNSAQAFNKSYTRPTQELIELVTSFREAFHPLYAEFVESLEEAQELITNPGGPTASSAQAVYALRKHEESKKPLRNSVSGLLMKGN